MSDIHVSRQARQKYQFDEGLFSVTGRAIVADYAIARRVAEKMSAHHPQPVPASDINAMGLLNEVFQILIRQYEMQNPGAFRRALDWLALACWIGSSSNSTLMRYVEEYPPQPVYHGVTSSKAYLNTATGNVPHRELSLEDILLLHITNLNPATQPYQELFDETVLKQTSAYDEVVRKLSDFLNGQPGFGGTGSGETLIQVLRAPAIASPYSLAGQLEFVIKKWGGLLGEAFIQRLLRGIDFVREEATRHRGPGGFGGEAPVLKFHGEVVSPRIRTFQRGQGLDATWHLDGEEHLRLAGAAFTQIRALDKEPERYSR